MVGLDIMDLDANLEEVAMDHDLKASNISLLSSLMKKVATEHHFCKSDGLGANDAYVSLQTTNSAYSGLLEYTFEHAAGVMCGTSRSGLLNSDDIAMAIFAAMTGHKGPTDGVVNLDSCRGTYVTKFEMDYRSPFFEAPINHLDGSCRNGDGVLDSMQRSPCQWYWHQS